MHSTTWADIDLAALRRNLGVVRRLAPASRVMAMLKANAYGHGLEACAQGIADQVDGMAVARIEEAESLLRLNLGTPILLTAAWLDAEALAWCSAKGVWVVLHDPETLSRVVRLNGPLGIWLKLNTGMHRLGFDPAGFRAAHAQLMDWGRATPLIAMTHFSSAEESDRAPTLDQIASFERATAGLRWNGASLANSAGLIRFPEARRDWVRPGIMLYGDDPCADDAGLGLRPVMALRSRILSVQRPVAGARVGYGRRWQSDGSRPLVAIGAGYADGYPRAMPDGQALDCQGETLQLAGRVSMDLITAEIMTGASMGPGQIVTLWGERPAVAAVARNVDTISYELLTRVPMRVPRVISS